MTPFKLPAVYLQRGQCIHSRALADRTAMERLPRLLSDRWKCTGVGQKGLRYLSQRLFLKLTPLQYTWLLGKASQRTGRNVLLRFITYKQSICSLWPPKPPLQANCNNEIHIILADFALQ